MRLVVLGRESLDELEKMVRPPFEMVVDHDASERTTAPEMFAPGTLPLALRLRPVKETRELALQFPVPSARARYAAKPMDYIAATQKDNSPIAVPEGTTLLDRNTRKPIFSNAKPEKSPEQWQLYMLSGAPQRGIGFDEWNRANKKAGASQQNNYNGSAVAGVDAQGRVHVAWEQLKPAPDNGDTYHPDGQSQVVVSTSTNAGQTWRNPVAIDPQAGGHQS